jgi:hypothetical protein
MAFAGGFLFGLPAGALRSNNITPDEETGIGSWTREQFITRFKSMDPVTHPPKVVAPQEFNTVMPWTMYAGMTEEDLGSLYDFLRTVPKVKNAVQVWTPKASPTQVAASN